VPPHLLGSVISLDFFVSLGLMPVSMAVSDPVGETIGITLTFLLAGTIPIVPTGLVKGWAVERATRALDRPARHSVLVNAGDDIMAQGNGTTQGDDGKPWRVGIEDPADRSRILAVVPLRSGGVATSGTAARGEHLVDPRTGGPRTGLRSVSVTGPSLMWADIWATAAFVAGSAALDVLRGRDGHPGVLVDTAGTVTTCGFAPPTTLVTTEPATG